MKPSSSSSTFHLNEAAAGCVAGILGRLLCGSLRGRAASGHGDEEQKAEQRKPQRPGIVARLMGLESMPVFPYAPPDSMGRSRSTNCVESRHGALATDRSSHGLQMTTSQSFREVPTYLRQENEDFLLLSFTPDDEEEASASKGTTPNEWFREMKERKSADVGSGKKETRAERKGEKKRRTKKRNDRQNCPKNGSVKVSEATSPVKPSIAKVKQAHPQRNVESECSPQNSSPVSVLDHPDIDEDCATTCLNSPTTSGGKPKELLNSRRKLSSAPNYLIAEEKPKQQSSRRKLSSDFENHNRMPPDKASDRSRNAEQACSQLLDTWGNVCRLTEEDVKSSTCFWRRVWGSEDYEDIAAWLGMEILDLLLREAVYEISNHTATS